MSLLDGLKQNNTITNTKGAQYYATSYAANLDFFSMVTRFNLEEDVINSFKLAFLEDEKMALANLLYILDIRSGKGERRIFKIIYKNLCLNYPKQALKIMPFIGELGRFDYILEGINTPIEQETIKVIKDQLDQDLTSDHPSLLAKWMPSLRTHKKNNALAKRVSKLLGISQKEYRKLIGMLRSKINIVEKHLTNKNYDSINFATVPAKAMMKYNSLFERVLANSYNEYKESLKKQTTKINTTGLFVHEIIKNILTNRGDAELYDLMWKNQKDLLGGVNSNILVVADTSGSMTAFGMIPFCASIGLAIYTAERNSGAFKNYFITFSEKPTLQEVKGSTIQDKVNNMIEINALNTDIDEVFKLILDTALEKKINQTEMPSHILIITDMEFDQGVYSQNETNFSGWKKAFEESGYNLPTIIFWNVAGVTTGIPITKLDDNVAIVSGFSTNILDNLFNLDSYDPCKVMRDTIEKYLIMLN